MKESVYKTRTTGFHRGTAWLYFYIFIRFPLGFLVSAVTVPYKYLPLLNGEMVVTNAPLFALGVFCDAAFIILMIATYLGLRKLTPKGYRLNIAFMSLNAFTFALSGTANAKDYVNIWFAFFGGIAFYSLVWLLPNMIYFKKRRELFKAPAESAGSAEGAFSNEIAKTYEGAPREAAPVPAGVGASEVPPDSSDAEKAAALPQPAFCRKCGAALLPEARFCLFCGTKQEAFHEGD